MAVGVSTQPALPCCERAACWSGRPDPRVRAVAEIVVESLAKEQALDVTALVRQAVKRDSVASGLCQLFVPHTTAAVTVNEGHDPDVMADLMAHLARLVPPNRGYRHGEGNSDAHIKAVLVGSSLTLPVVGGEVVLGRWQSVFLCEFDGPRHRRLLINVFG